MMVTAALWGPCHEGEKAFYLAVSLRQIRKLLLCVLGASAVKLLFWTSLMKFIVDRMLGKLAKGLRMLGYDTIYYRGDDLHHLFHMARLEGRVILTRNTKLIPRRPEDRVYQVTEDNPHDQLRQLIEKGHVPLNEEKFFCRCLLCNALLDQIPLEKAEGNVPDFVFHQQKEFFQCPQCKRIYWPGTHQKNMQKNLEELLGPGI